MDPIQGSVLIVDDSDLVRDLLSHQLDRLGHQVTAARNGHEALELIQSQKFDVMLLDIMMPEMDGYQVLECVEADPSLRHIPVIVISAVDTLNSVVRCIEMGAEDYLFKPFNQVILKARIQASLEKKRLRDQEQAALMQLQVEQERSERLLLNILPRPIADRLKQGQSTIADRFEEVTVLFADLVGFTRIWRSGSPAEIVELLNSLFSRFDHLAERHGLEKIKTIGDEYMVVGGLPEPRPDHTEAIANIALDMQEAMVDLRTRDGNPLRLRVGIDCGPVIAGVIGEKKFSYDLWGDPVNTAHSMQINGVPGCIQVTPTVVERLQDHYLFDKRGSVNVKGKGVMEAYLLRGQREPATDRHSST